MHTFLHVKHSARRREGSAVSSVIWLGLCLLAFVLYHNRPSFASRIDAGFLVCGLLAAFAGVLSAFAYFHYVVSGEVRRSPTRQLTAGLFTLIPPSIIAFAIVPMNATFAPLVICTMFLFGALGLSALGEWDPAVRYERLSGRSWHSNPWDDEDDDDSLLPDQPGLRLADLPAERDQNNVPRTVQRDQPSSLRERPSDTALPPETEPLDDYYEGYRDDYYEHGESHDDDPDVFDSPIPTEPKKSKRRKKRREKSSELDDYSSLATVADPPGAPGLPNTMERFVAPDRMEYVEGTVELEFAPGQSRAVCHLPFMPPLAAQPDVECEVVDDSDIRVKAAEVRTYGLRIEGKRRDSTHAQFVDVGIAVKAPAQPGAPVT